MVLGLIHVLDYFCHADNYIDVQDLRLCSVVQGSVYKINYRLAD